MSVVKEPEVNWTSDQMVEISLGEPDDFLKVRETLTRIGVASRKEKKIYQSCHILHKQGRYYIVHFKELFALDGKRANLTVNDVQRRNRIVQLLVDWGQNIISEVRRKRLTRHFFLLRNPHISINSFIHNNEYIRRRCLCTIQYHSTI